ncbi:hypothetical protein M011DRAFT_154507 [Sporormia fimetaria CBS 119925]|uniref:Uncharacterized protein n=1 Tax=Sporormia fimetaria CBS 119925 TaxID=1340428 RepID=A0A6A6V6R1_9PLEO|nr:hypothetical protein M011DRAFT_154507 [Sporormia fimetaria CBS 119925]
MSLTYLLWRLVPSAVAVASHFHRSFSLKHYIFHSRQEVWSLKAPTYPVYLLWLLRSTHPLPSPPGSHPLPRSDFHIIAVLNSVAQTNSLSPHIMPDLSSHSSIPADAGLSDEAAQICNQLASLQAYEAEINRQRTVCLEVCGRATARRLLF